MKMKLFTILFITAVLVSSFAASVLPSANAFTQRTDFSNRHSSASYGNSHICGDHKCGSGEQSQMGMKISAAQRGGNENLKQLRAYGEMHGEDVMHKIAGSTTSPSTMHGNIKVTDKLSVGTNMTDKANVTKGTK